MALTDLKFRATNANVTTLITGLSLNGSQVVNRPLTHEELDSNFLHLAKHSEDMNSDAIAEGSTNLYFTNARADARADVRISASSVGTLSDVTITSPATNSLLQWNGSAWIDAVPTTAHVTENASNKYYTDARVLTKVNATSVGALSDVYLSSPTNGQVLKYNSSNSRFEAATDNTPANTDTLTEGSSNLYFTNARADARADVRIAANLIDEDAMGTNSATRAPSQQSVKAYIATQIATKDNSDEIAEGSTNLYFTNARADARIGAASVNALSDVTISTPVTNNVLKYNGTAWVNTTSIDLEKFTANTGNQNNVSMFTRFEPSAAQTYRTLNLRAESSTDMTHSGYGPSLGFMVRDDAGVDNSIGSISCTRDGADNTGKFTMSLYNAGAFNEVMTIDKDGNTTRTGALGLKVLASDPSVSSDFAHVYAKDDSGSAEIFVKDEAGNVTKISPHNEQGEWEYFSRNVNTGKVMRVNMEELIKDIEKLTGKQYIREE
jgi:hypothetical protein